MNFLDYGTDNVEYEFINRTILYGNFMRTSLIITKRNYDDIDADNYSCQCFYIIIFSSSPYALKSDLNIDGQVISSGEILFEGTYYFPININSHYYFSPKNKSNDAILSLR